METRHARRARTTAAYFAVTLLAPLLLAFAAQPAASAALPRAGFWATATISGGLIEIAPDPVLDYRLTLTTPTVECSIPVPDFTVNAQLTSARALLDGTMSCTDGTVFPVNGTYTWTAVGRQLLGTNGLYRQAVVTECSPTSCTTYSPAAIGLGVI